jgi:hypothetical protein
VETLLHVDSTSAINWTKKLAKVSSGHVSSMTRRGLEPCSPAAMFQVVDVENVMLLYHLVYGECITRRELLMSKKEV